MYISIYNVHYMYTCIIGKMKATAISVYYVDPNFLLNIHIPPDMTLKRLKQLTVIYIYIPPDVFLTTYM